MGLGFSGYYSKDAILEQALTLNLYKPMNPFHSVLFLAAAAGAAITAFYMFRMWFMTFARQTAQPTPLRSRPRIAACDVRTVVVLAVLAVFALAVAWSRKFVRAQRDLLEQARPAGTLATVEQGGGWLEGLTIPGRTPQPRA